jgi:UDP-N-acetylglucosamine/UDP-N-acetyl-alpha-D-glucosaminouronate 4-epimerase
MRRLSRVLVTGGAGFIGSHLVDKLVTDGAEVVVLDNLSSGKIRNIATHLRGKNVRFVRGDICNLKLVRSIVSEVDVVVNLAAIVGVPISIENPLRVHEVNATGTLNLLKASLDSGVKRFVQASSAAVYGEAETLPVCEDSVLAPSSPYAVSKIAAEDYARVFSRVYGLETVCLRFFNVFGPRQAYNPYTGVITIFVKELLNDRAPTIFGDGEQTRDFVSVYDVVLSCVLAMTKRGIGGEVFNVSSGKMTTINELVRLLQEITGKSNLNPAHAEARCGDIRHSWGDIDKTRTVLGYNPRVTLKEGLRELKG